MKVVNIKIPLNIISKSLRKSRFAHIHILQFSFSCLGTSQRRRLWQHRPTMVKKRQRRRFGQWDRCDISRLYNQGGEKYDILEKNQRKKKDIGIYLFSLPQMNEMLECFITTFYRKMKHVNHYGVLTYT